MSPQDSAASIARESVTSAVSMRSVRIIIVVIIIIVIIANIISVSSSLGGEHMSMQLKWVSCPLLLVPCAWRPEGAKRLGGQVLSGLVGSGVSISLGGEHVSM